MIAQSYALAVKRKKKQTKTGTDNPRQTRTVPRRRPTHRHKHQQRGRSLEWPGRCGCSRRRPAPRQHKVDGGQAAHFGQRILRRTDTCSASTIPARHADHRAGSRRQFADAAREAGILPEFGYIKPPAYDRFKSACRTTAPASSKTNHDLRQTALRPKFHRLPPKPRPARHHQRAGMYGVQTTGKP